MNSPAVDPERAPKPLANPITVMLDKPRKLIFDMNAAEILEELTGKSLIGGDFRGDSISDIRAFFYACAKWEDPKLTVETVGAHMFIHQFQEAVKIMLRLMSVGSGDPDSLAPYVPTPTELLAQVLELSNMVAGEQFLDIGCGDGRLLLMAAQIGAVVTGIESHEQRAKVAGELVADYQGTIIQDKIQTIDDETSSIAKAVREADVVYVYLLTESNARISEQLEKYMKPGSRVITLDFRVPGWTHKDNRLHQINAREYRLYLYEMGQHKPLEVKA